MNNVTLAIGGRNFTVACAEGEEAHVTGLGQLIAGKVATMGDSASQNESRMLLFAALLLADELHEQGSGRASSTPVSPPVPSQQPDGLATRLGAIAGRLENLASRLEDDSASA
jgi:cell division protein ZapA